MADDYGLSREKPADCVEPPALDLGFPRPRRPWDHRIAVIGAGGISEFHLKNYAAEGWNVVVIADRHLERAAARRDAFFPAAEIASDALAAIRRPDVTVVDLTLHPCDRVPLVREAILAGKHVLSQKPFVIDPAEGTALAALARDHGVRLAVNHNGRWAPHFRYLLQAVRAGVTGPLRSVDFTLQWDHTWTAGIQRFEAMPHLVLFDFGIHWFDLTACLFAGWVPQSVRATCTRFPGQRFGPPALASVCIDYPGAQARMSFNAHVTRGEEDCTTLVGERATLRCRGRGLNEINRAEVFLEAGRCDVALHGCWFEDGFRGTMGELLLAIEENREPENHAASSLPGLELCLAAIRSAGRNGAPEPYIARTPE